MQLKPADMKFPALSTHIAGCCLRSGAPARVLKSFYLDLNPERFLPGTETIGEKLWLLEGLVSKSSSTFPRLCG